MAEAEKNVIARGFLSCMVQACGAVDWNRSCGTGCHLKHIIGRTSPPHKLIVGVYFLDAKEKRELPNPEVVVAIGLRHKTNAMARLEPIRITWLLSSGPDERL
jgi:hypothetical protein